MKLSNMAEDAVGKTIKVLKGERTIAKSSFTRQANFLDKEASTMVETELKEGYNKLHDCFRKVIETNDDYRLGSEDCR